MNSSRRKVLLLILVLAIKCDTKKPRLKEGKLPEKRDYRPSKWLANSAMDVWYGNKSMVHVIAREFSDVLYKLTMRPVRTITQRLADPTQKDVKGFYWNDNHTLFNS